VCLCVCVCVCVLGNSVVFPVPESNGYITMMSYTVQGLVFQEVFQSVHSAVVFWLLFPSGQFSAVSPSLQWRVFGSCPVCGVLTWC